MLVKHRAVVYLGDKAVCLPEAEAFLLTDAKILM